MPCFCTQNFDLVFLFFQTQRHIIKQEGAITKLVWDVERPSIYTAGTDGIVRHFDVRSGVLVQEWLGHRAHILDLSRSKYANT